jgi:hypothetical protein
MFDALNILVEEEEPENHILLVEDGGGTWVREEAVVDSGAVDCAMTRETMLHLEVEPTPESRRGETWSCAGGKPIAKAGNISVKWRTNEGANKSSNFKVGHIRRTLVSISRFHETGHDEGPVHQAHQHRGGHQAASQQRHVYHGHVDRDPKPQADRGDQGPVRGRDHEG